MKKFAIAHANLFDNEIKIHFVTAETDVIALASFLRNESFEVEDDKSVQELEAEAFNGDALVTVRELPQ